MPVYQNPRKNSSVDSGFRTSSSVSTDASPDYKLKPVYTIKKIVAGLGYTGEDAKKYEKALEAQLEADGSFMNDKKWLMAGSNIKLLSDEKLKELGISKPKTPIRQERNTNESVVSASNEAQSPNGRGRANFRGSSSQVKPENRDEASEIVKNSSQRILDIIKENRHNGRTVTENELSEEQKRFVKVHAQAYKKQPQLIKNDTTGEIHVFFDTTDTEPGQKIGMQSIEYILGSGIEKTNRYYNNGKIVQDVKKITGEEYSTLIQDRKDKEPVTQKQILTPLSIDIKVDPSVYEGASESQKKEIDEFINTIESQKAELMKDLNIDSDTYNRFAQLACAIAMQETGFGKAKSYKKFDGTVAGTVLKDTAAVTGKVINDTTAWAKKSLIRIGVTNNESGTNHTTAVSKGLTQVKIADWDDNPRIQKLFVNMV
jgi:hypothetical protein